MKNRYLLYLVLVVGTAALAVIGFLVYRGVLVPQNILPSLAAGDQYGNKLTHYGCADVGASGEVVKLNDNDSTIKYSKEWGYKKGGGGSQICYQQDYHFVPDFINQKLDVTKNYGAFMEYTFTGNRVDVRFIEGGNRGYADIFIDGVKVDSYNAHTGGGIYGRPAWRSPQLSCGQHTLKVAQSDTKVDNNAKGIVIDFVQHQKCTPNAASVCAQLAGEGANTDGCTQSNVGQACPGTGTSQFKVCVNSACALSSTATADSTNCAGKNVGDSCSLIGDHDDGDTTKIICQNNSCVSLTTAGANDPACSGKNVGDTCGVSAEELKCQGNQDAPAKCFDCKKDFSSQSLESEINILDFSCFSKYYGENVGKN